MTDVTATDELRPIEIGPTDARGFRRQTPPSDRIEHAAIKAAAEQWERDRDAADEAHRELGVLENGASAADAADAQALADALEAGSKDPGPRHRAALDAKVADAKRRADALRIVATRSLDAFTQAVEEGQRDWYAGVCAQHEAAREEAAAALATLSAKLGDLNRLRALRRFVAGSAPTLPRDVEAPQPATLARNVSMGEALGVLAREIEPPAPPRRLQYREGGGELRDVQPGTGKWRVVGAA